jgi:hypothetical protein
VRNLMGGPGAFYLPVTHTPAPPDRAQTCPPPGLIEPLAAWRKSPESSLQQEREGDTRETRESKESWMGRERRGQTEPRFQALVALSPTSRYCTLTPDHSTPCLSAATRRCLLLSRPSPPPLPASKLGYPSLDILPTAISCDCVARLCR